MDGRGAKCMTHDEKVAWLCEQIASFYKTKTPFRVFHGTTNTTRILSFKRSSMVDISHLDKVLEVDTERSVALVEPNVPMDKLARATLKKGLVPEVVMEFPGITVGGGVAGVGGESSSFKFGTFSETCESFEIITPDGKVRTVSAKKNPDLFHNFGGSFGTLGVLTKAAVRLVPAKRCVNLTYLPVKSFAEAVDTLQKHNTGEYDYADGIMFAKNRGVIMVGKMSDDAKGRKVRFTRARDPWFYLHVDEITTETTEAVPLRDYLFRYDRGGFWVGRYAFEIFGVKFNQFYRWLLNPILHTRQLYEALQDSGASQQFIVQDLGLPLQNATDFMNFIDRKFKIYPLWLCPMRPNLLSPFSVNNLKTQLAINIGVWGDRVENYDEFVKQNRLIETELARMDGKKWLYSHSYYPRDEFWKIYNKKAYDTLRRKYHADHLPNVYEKISVKKVYPIEIKRGLLRTITRRARLRVEN